MLCVDILGDCVYFVVEVGWLFYVELLFMCDLVVIIEM